MKEFHDVTVYVRIIKICILKGLTIPIVCSSSQMNGLCMDNIGIAFRVSALQKVVLKMYSLNQVVISNVRWILKYIIFEFITPYKTEICIMLTLI